MNRADPRCDQVALAQEKLSAVELELTPEDLGEINTAALRIAIHGERLPEAAQKMTGR